MSYGLAQARYASDATATVTPARLLLMLYDRLISDLMMAEAALTTHDVQVTGERIGRAQEILLELHATLDVTVWPEGEPLTRLYLWMVGELSTARLRQEPQRVADCRELLEPLRDAWRTAAVQSVHDATAPGPAGGIGGAA